MEGSIILFINVVVDSQNWHQLVWPSSLTGRGTVACPARTDRSDRSKEESESNKVFCRSRSVIGITCGINPPHPINIKGHGRLRVSIEQNQYKLYFLSSSPNPSFSNPLCCSSFVSATFEGVLGGLPILEQSYVRLPWRGPSRVRVRRLSPILTGDRSDRSYRPVWPLHAGRAASSSFSRCTN